MEMYPKDKYKVQAKISLLYNLPDRSMTRRALFVKFRGCLKISKKIFQKRPIERVADDSGGVLVAERERTTLSPNERG